MKKNKQIHVKNLYTHALYEFLCFSKEHPEYFIYKIQPMENQFEMGLIINYEPVGMTWEEVKEYENQISVY